jgi:flagellar protein FlaJ
MDTTTRNHLASAFALLGVAVAVASIAPLASTLQGGLAIAGLALVAGALHAVAPAGRERTEERAGPNVLATLVLVLAGMVALLLVAALAARVGGFRYLGEQAVFLSENFTVVTGPFTALLGVAAVAAARGHMHPSTRVDPLRRFGSGLALTVLGAVAALMAGDLVGEPWQAPYIVGLGAVVAWRDAILLAGLPTPRDVGRWLERGETETSRALMRGLARGGNAAVLVLGLASAGLFAVGSATYGMLALGAAAALLTLTTHAAAGLTRAVPTELGGEVTADGDLQRLRLLGIGPLLVAIVAAVSVAAAVAVLGGAPMAGPLTLARPAAGALVALLAGLNLARSGLPSFDGHTPVRRAVTTVTAGLLAASLFFALIVELGVLAGPVTEAGLGLLFTYTALLSVGVFVVARGLYPVPGTDLEQQPGEVEEAAGDDKAELERSLMAIYVTASLFVVAAIGFLAMVMVGGIDLGIPESGEGRNAAFLATLGLGLTLLLGLVIVFARSRQLDTPHEEEIDFERDYTPEEIMRLTVLGVSGTLAFVLGLLGVLVKMGQLESIAGFALEPRYSTDLFVFAVLIGIGPAGYLHNREKRRIQAIDERLPEFLRDLAESQRTGMTLTQAVITASEGNYGALTPEIEKMAAQIEWGVSFDRALKSFAERVDTPLVQRSVSLVIEASNSGGDVMDVLQAAAEDAREIQQIKHERKSGMQIYVMIIYIAFLVFIGVIGVLNVKFMPEVARAVGEAEGVSVGSITFEDFDMQTFQTLFFHAAVIQGLGGGFVAGSMEEGRPSAGLKHAFAMTMMAYLAFRLLLGG